jgi:hypothetical protein
MCVLYLCYLVIENLDSLFLMTRIYTCKCLLYSVLLEANLVFYLVLKKYVLDLLSGGRGGYNSLILSGYKTVSIFFLCYVT